VTKYLAIGAAVTIALMGVACWLLFKEVESLKGQVGELRESNRQLTETVNAKTKATQGRAQNDSTVRQLPPAGIIERLR
jgi:hypothetical protein